MRIFFIVCLIVFSVIAEEPNFSSSAAGDWVLYSGDHTLMIADAGAKDFERRELTSIFLLNTKTGEVKRLNTIYYETKDTYSEQWITISDKTSSFRIHLDR